MAERLPRECSVADALDLVGERWSLLAVREISHGFHRFDQIVRNTGASRDILTARLRKLEDAGILRRRRYSEHPPRYEYHLTEPGHELNDVLIALMKWGDKYLNPDDPPVRFVHSCGETLTAEVVCAHCGRPAREGLHTPTGRGALAH
ncbi:putative HTH-type transcriptional regulator YtcD [Actinomadura rubteroloni]|uniref:Putative HTH-type transcriptional regulator YtcD n=1 Tax=Actinomadura rubteroloni TaxID=1926885 RepID=A0A2P4UEG6_9ACTN|nr:helix-turn-helix domain-containing protein [Actinomadura rubteroloni]POM23445.1 putative HTH-type transcriptional regulator YtcD [Actinomadura rubteroloni]